MRKSPSDSLEGLFFLLPVRFPQWSSSGLRSSLCGSFVSTSKDFSTPQTSQGEQLNKYTEGNSKEEPFVSFARATLRTLCLFLVSTPLDIMLNMKVQ